MTEFIENIKNNPKTQKDINLIVNNYSNQSNRTQTEIDQKAIIQRRFFEKAKEISVETIEDMDEEMDVEENKSLGQLMNKMNLMVKSNNMSKENVILNLIV